MARITVEDCLTKETNRFSLILLASKRTKQILEGAPVLLDNVKNKAVVTALREIAAGKVRFMSEEDMAKKRAQEQAEREALLAKKEAAAAMNGDSGRSTNGSSAPAEEHIDADSIFKSAAEMAEENKNNSD
ncbi:MAG: DNA-directed RNA polymerase subunit omega, partial [Bdellovibrionales bacterium]|nr:DNA-directed RNA polymerase subunit omega [Bdellovibrionales bacterium]